MLTNHIWSVAGTDTRKEVNSTFIQPFASYITASKTTFTINSESTYDWDGDHWNIPINIIVSQLLKIYDHPIQFGIGPRIWIDSPKDGAEGVGLRAQITLLFPE